MGVIRKTASIGTLGMVNFRSKKEKLARATRSERAALAERDAEHLAREVVESSFEKVEHELRRLSDAEAKAARQLSRLRRRSRRVRKAERLNSVLATAEPKVRDGMEAARKHGRRARKAATRAGHEVRKGAEKAVDEARSVLQD